MILLQNKYQKYYLIIKEPFNVKQVQPCLCVSLPGESLPAQNRQTDREMDGEGHLNKITDFMGHVNRKFFPRCKSNYVVTSGSIHPLSFKGNSDEI